MCLQKVRELGFVETVVILLRLVDVRALTVEE